MSDAIIETLDAIRLALRDGDYGALAGLVEQLDTETADMAARSQADLVALRQRAAETAACLGAARNGIRAARRRVAEVSGGPDALSTYDRDGRRSAGPAMTAAAKRL